ncbi:molybdate ABC transporter substrate-binding protein [Roseospira goensis]|uniref:Molybdate transport system substrate-binding protein n=1 Tax=Roseospira goensis TaxID=391922 RepID=A0A7W6WJY2_9PROT|nr:molybdate ABC transporter substrate-binding protein [Roseospira goensis]MBB4285540.1 molybdate transport system substrate-binding protein [Roseospira goensis]
MPALPLSRRHLLAALSAILTTGVALPRITHAQTAFAVYADPSLRVALETIVPVFRQRERHPLMLAFGDVSGATGVTGAIVHDVLIVAGAANMAPLVDAGQVEPPTDLLANRLALVAAPGAPAPAALTRGMDLTRWVDRRRPLAIVDPTRNAIGRDALDALRFIGWDEGVSRRVLTTPTVAAARDAVARGDAALGVVFANTAARDAEVRMVGAFPPDAHAPIVYQVAVKAGTPADAPARAFVHALYGETARAAFLADGLKPRVAR